MYVQHLFPYEIVIRDQMNHNIDKLEIYSNVKFLD